MYLKEYLEDECIEIKSFAMSSGIPVQTLYYWLNTGCIPRQCHREIVEKATKGKVTIKEWGQRGRRLNKRQKSC